MDVIYWLIPLSIVILIIAVIILFWAVRSGQFQDLDSAAVEILFDDDTPAQSSTITNKPQAPHQPRAKTDSTHKHSGKDKS